MAQARRERMSRSFGGQSDFGRIFQPAARVIAEGSTSRGVEIGPKSNYGEPHALG